ncbi:uncharacterized protein LOC126832825 [Adelges cooleyi]|uniref:uncharacterized protein LOC126832825 n=1 Tax=Adelges cooleyi TaxID=133065 RepID=UPI00217F47F2|nr:uncharacterized protein LOC126832825 [Adelges cooleyi]
MKSNMSAVLFAIYFFGLVVSSNAMETDAIENLKSNLYDYYLLKCYVRPDIASPSTYNLHPNYLNAVNAAKVLLLEGNIGGGRTKLINATKAMIIDRPDLIENQPLLENHINNNSGLNEIVLQKIEKVVNSFVNDVAKE